MNVTVIDQNNVKISIDRGLIGPQGISGFSGISGYSGYSGISGYSGSGISGYSGYSGQQGTSINVKGEVATVEDLPPTGNQVNDAYIVTADGDLWIWDGSAWFDAGQIVGPQGFSGISGFSGYSGFSGESGYSGFSGISGYSGSGVSGYSGDSGISGYSGWSGESGYSGISGFSGDSGISGFSGDSGISGYSGYSGISGFSGSGISGWSGESGYSGYSGISGYSGYSGEVGTSGFSGFSGYSGAVGESGYSGISGYSGFSGISGQDGASGTSGYSGASGFSGISGWSGESGFSGFSGISGYSGAIGQSSSLFLYYAEAVQTSGQPANGFLLWNNATQSNATQINVSHLTNNGDDIDIFLALLQPTQKFTIQDQNASANYQSWLITGTTTNVNAGTGNSYWTIPVSLISSGGTGTTDFADNHPLFLAITAGVSGTSGYSGYSGFSGISGWSGESGFSGISGWSGEVGASGFSGISGFSGYSGISGQDGASGYSGISGASGFSGISGYSGYSGIDGASGFSGYSGISGYSGSGVSGYSGFSGISGYSGYSGITPTIGGSNTQVQYNNSGVLGGSANFTWSGTALAVTGLISTSVGATTTNALNINTTSAGYGSVITHQTNGVTKYTAGLNVFTGTGEWGIYDNTASLNRFYLSSTGYVGIGNTNPTALLTLGGVAATGYESFLSTGTTTAYNYATISNTGSNLRIGIESATAVGILTGSTNYSACIGTLTASNLHLGTNSTVRATFDASGNLGLGVTPSAWQTTSGSRAIQFTGSAVYGYRDTNLILTQNAYFDGAFKYYAGFIPAAYYGIGSGVHAWYTSTSAQVINTDPVFSQAMTLDASGRLGIGATSVSAQLHVQNANGNSGMGSDNTGMVYVESTYNTTGSNNNASFIAKNRYGYSQFMQWENFGLRIGNRATANSGAGEVVFTYGNDSEGMRITSAGNVLVNNSGTQYVQLQPDGSIRSVHSNGGGGDSIFGAITGVSNGYQILVTVGNAQTYKWHNGGTQSMTLDADGDLGIGTTNPVQRLQVSSAVGNPATSGSTQNGIVRLSNTTDNGVLDIGIKSGGTGAWLQSTDGGASGLANQYPLLLNPVGGNVGIGTSSPNSKLEVAATVDPVITINGTDLTQGNRAALFMAARNVNGNSGNVSIEAISVNNQQNDMVFRTGSTAIGSFGTERMRITTAGKTIIGSNTTVGAGGDAQLTVNGNSLVVTPNTAGKDTHVLTTGTADYGTYAIKGDTVTKVYLNTNGDSYFNGGNLLVGTASALANSGRLQVLGQATTTAMNVQIGTDGYAGINFNNSSASQQGYIQVNTATVLYTSVSDYRLKNTVLPMTGALAKVAQLKPVTYKWNSNDLEGQGFIAHELAEVCPDAVSGEKDAIDADGKPKYQGIDTSFLVATLVSAIQEQQALIESLTTRLTALENK